MTSDSDDKSLIVNVNDIQGYELKVKNKEMYLTYDLYFFIIFLLYFLFYS